MGIKKYKAGIVGCGNIGGGFDKGPGRKPIYTHAGAYVHDKRFKLAAAADLNPKVLKNFAKKWNIKNVYPDFNEMLDKESLDILSVCTGKESHYAVIEKAVKKGVKIIFCEKPFTGSIIQAKKAISLCRKNNVLLAVNYTRRYTCGFQKVRRLIFGGKLGRIQAVNCSYTKGIINNGSHFLDLLGFLFGKPSWAASLTVIDGSKKAKDHDLSANLYFSQGFFVSAFCFDARYYSIFEIDILGTLGRIKMTESGCNIRHYRVKTSQVFKDYKEPEENGSLIVNDMGKAMTNAIGSIVKAYQTKSPLICSGSDGLEALKIIDLIVRSAKNNGKKEYYH